MNRFVEADEYAKLVENELPENVLQALSKPVNNVGYSMGYEKSIVQNINADQDPIKDMHSLNELSLQVEKKTGEKFDIAEDDVLEITLRNYLAVGVQWVSLVTENLLSHPFIVLRRQCQVFNTSNRYHIHPITLLPSILNLQRRQGLATLWKGVGSCLLVRGMTLAIDDIISKFTGWPKEVNSKTTLKRFGQHILLK
ncbi:mitochondrial outer membrane protein SLC25A46-like isoform X6 [Drosophila bipectinata]|nr:solute carrier family 25 member 46-like isoform X6 [Drosophila bipectinata]